MTSQPPPDHLILGQIAAGRKFGEIPPQATIDSAEVRLRFPALPSEENSIPVNKFFQRYIMANIRSAAKRARQTIVRTARNRIVKTRVKSARRAFNEALQAGNLDLAKEKLQAASSAADKAVKSNVIHKNSANRIKTLLASALNKATA